MTIGIKCLNHWALGDFVFSLLANAGKGEDTNSRQERAETETDCLNMCLIGRVYGVAALGLLALCCAGAASF